MTQPITEAEKPAKCSRCDGRKVISVLGSGGDFEDWPCPKCDGTGYAKALHNYYGHTYDGEGNE